ncbi:uncharacterized protein LOC113781305 [Coffea eugenioides]|uniref:Uncharacterized protein isoform X2 n=1 Tax=Coffea arabica TaxID=13443 RepID=A0ABM4VEC4_COFAR|nr:uncharacterized protein LOC113704204 [Coffea arabica]XP_027183022.1 uncharacterized protein LOC113781305 [Coffea eugenioides]
MLSAFPILPRNQLECTTVKLLFTLRLRNDFPRRMESDDSIAPEPGTNEQQPRHQNSVSPKFNEEEEEAAEENPVNRNEKEEPKTTSFPECKDVLKAVEVVERDSVAIAQSFASLFASLRLALSQVTRTSVDHMSCFSDAAGRLQESALDAATKGNRYINSCLRLNEEMKGIDNLASQLKILRRNVDALDSAVNRMVRLP